MALFGTAGIRGPVNGRVTPELAVAVGKAIGDEGAAGKTGAAGGRPTVVVGRDGRLTSPALADAVAAGLQSTGVHVQRAGMVPTPALAYASRGRRGVMVTASHNPPQDNGLKLFVDGREYDRDGEQAIATRIEDGPAAGPWEAWGDSSPVAPLKDYRTAVVAYAERHGAPLTGLRLVVDCGNGTAALATPQVLRALGADVVTLDANVDGFFPGRSSKPTTEALTTLRELMAETDGTDDAFVLGIAHDGDADRVVFVDGAGEVVHEDTVVAILAHHYVKESDADDPVVLTTPNASTRIDERVATAGGRVERVALGTLPDGVSRIQARRDDAQVAFAAEPWKHIHPELGPWIDGVASAAVLAGLVAANGLDPLVEPIAERPARKGSVDCPEDVKDAVMSRLAESLPAAYPEANVSTSHGVRLSWTEAWVLVRPSGTEPVVRIYVESDDAADLLEAVREHVTSAVDAAR